MLIATFVVTRGIADTIDLSEFALEHWYPLPRVERRAIARELSDGLAKQLRTAHAGGFFHHDIKWRNVLVRQREGHWETIWIDAPRASRMRFREHRGVVVDLSCLGRMAVQLLCPYECMRFVCRYLGRERTPGAAKNLFREVQAHLDRRPPKPLVLPPRPDDHQSIFRAGGHTDHWPVMQAAKRAGLRVAALRTAVAYHANLPLYGEPWH